MEQPKSKWLRFEEKVPAGYMGRKTAIYAVLSAGGGSLSLGEIKWWSAWRCFAFFPVANTLFETDCMTDIVAFMDWLTDQHRKQRPKVFGLDIVEADALPDNMIIFTAADHSNRITTAGIAGTGNERLYAALNAEMAQYVGQMITDELLEQIHSTAARVLTNFKQECNAEKEAT